MVTAKRLTLTLVGGAPWGFRMAGGGALPLAINKIRKKSVAHTSGLQEGDSVISINGTPVHDKSHDEALELVENAGDTLTLEIFRGDMADDLSRAKPKKTILIGGGAGEEIEGGLVLTATVGEVSDAAGVTTQGGAETSADLVLTASVDAVSSDSYVTAEDGGGAVPGFTATLGDVSESSFDNINSGFTMTASTDDVTSSSIMVDSITAEVGDLVSAGIDFQAAPASVSPNLAQPFTDSNVIAVSPTHLSPLPPRGSLSPRPVALSPKPIASSPRPSALSPAPMALSPKPVAFSPAPATLSPAPTALSPKPVAFSPAPATLSPAPMALSPKPVAFSPKPLALSPTPLALSPKPVSFSPQPKAPSPRSPIPPPTSPKPTLSTSPKPGAAVLPIVQNASPKPFLAPSPSSMQTPPPPSNVSSNTVMSTETFDDGQGHTKRETTTVTTTTTQRGNKNNNNVSGNMFTQQDTRTTVTTKTGSSLVKHQDSAFDTPAKFQRNTQTVKPIAMKGTTTNTAANVNNYNNNNNNNKSRNGPTPFSAPPPPPQLDPISINTTPNLASSHPLTPAPVFKPTKFVIGRSRKEATPLNYPPGLMSPKADVPAQGKENVQPMFQVKNIVGDKAKKRRDTWKANAWLPGQQQQQQQHLPKQQHHQDPLNAKDDFSPYNTFPVPQVHHGVSLMEPRSRSDSRHRYEVEDYEDYDDLDRHGNARRPDRLHIFGPPVEIHAPPEDSGYPDSPYSPFLPYRDDGEIDVGFVYEEGPSSPDSSTWRKKKLYSDSAFYDTPGKSYPTITEQMKLCKIIATSLTSQANRRARGAKMFMKRKRKSNKWVHDGHSEWSSSAGDVANLHDLDSELSVDDGGSKPLFYFKIPNLKNRISSADRKMALTQEQFERLRLQANKCDHKNVTPTTCFNIVEDLKTSRGKGGRMFEKRKVRVEKYVVDEKNARHARPRARLETALTTPIRQEKTPWEAAIQHGGNVDAAFSHIDEMDRNQKLNQILKYQAPKKLPTSSSLSPTRTSRAYAKVETPSFQSNLKDYSSSTTLQGKNFNRTARGWGGGGEYPVADKLLTVQPPAKKPSTPSAVSTPAPPMLNSPRQGDYNPKIKAWQSSGSSPYVNTSSPSTPRPQQQQQPQPKPQLHYHQPQQPPSWGHQSWHADVHQSQRPVDPVSDWRSKEDIHTRPKSWVSDSYDVNQYKDEYDYTYVPVDYKFSEDVPSSPAYRQPIIPGTDL